MVFLSIIFVSYLAMLLLPLGISLSAWRLDNMPLNIRLAYRKDPRYFSLSFQSTFDSAWDTYAENGILQLSREENVIEVDKTTIPPLTTCEAIVYAHSRDFIPSEGIYFEKEVYVRSNARLDNIPLVRAIACRGNLVLGAGTRVVRWADAEGVFTVHDGCNLGISATSATKMIIGENCYFKRLYAPEIYFGQGDDKQNLEYGLKSVGEPLPLVFQEITRNLRYVDDEIVDSEKKLRGSIVTTHDVTVLGGLEVQGHIRSSRSIKIDSNATVHGNVFAEGNIFVGANARVYGVLFSQEDIIIDSGATVGLPGRLKSVVARGNITLASRCRVYGYVGTEATGSTGAAAEGY